MNFTLANPEAMVGLPPGKYQTRVVSADWPSITVEYAGRPYDPDNPCLLPLTVHAEEDPKVTTFEDMVAAVEHGGNPYTILRDGQPVAVLVGHDDWQTLVDAVRGGEGGN